MSGIIGGAGSKSGVIGTTELNYEEGYFDANVTLSSSGSYTMAAENEMAYTKIGRVVHIQGEVEVASESSPSGDLRVALPFAGASLTNKSDYCWGVAMVMNNSSTLPHKFYCQVTPGLSYVLMKLLADDGTMSQMDKDDVDTNFNLGLIFTYISV